MVSGYRINARAKVTKYLQMAVSMKVSIIKTKCMDKENISGPQGSFTRVNGRTILNTEVECG